MAISLATRQSVRVDRARNLAVNREKALARVGQAPPFDGATLRRLAGAHRDPDDRGLWLTTAAFIANSDADAGWKQLITALDAAPDDDILCHLGVLMVEPFIDTHPYYVLEHLRDVQESRNFRAVLTCCWFSVPPDVEEALDALLPEAGSPDDIGGMGE